MNGLMVTNRHGELELLNVKKIQEKTYKSCYGLDGTDALELETDAKIDFFTGIKTNDIQKTLVMTGVQKIDIDRPNWTFVAARLFLEDMYHKVGILLQGEKGNPYAHLKRYLEYGEKTRLNKSFFRKYSEEDIEVLNDIIQSGIKDVDGDKYHERDYQFTYLGMKTFFDRYALKDEKGMIFELPQHMFMGLSMFLAQNEKDKVEWAIKFYNMISKFEFMPSTPTLSNGRTTRNQLSSCYVGAAPDNIEGIFDSYREMALLSKYGGGIGWDWMDIRSGGSEIDNNKGASGGPIPFLKIVNDIAIAVDQLGTRKGSIAVYLEPWHKDIYDFIDLKKNSGEERRRAHDLFPALWIPDLFMERAKNDEIWTLFDPHETEGLHELHGKAFEEAYLKFENDNSIKKEVINAKDLWKKILTSYFETGSPFLIFKDESNRRNANDHLGLIRSSNLCLEIFQNTSPNLYGIQLEFNDGTSSVFEEEQELEIYISETETYKKKAKKINNIDIIVLNGELKDVLFSSRVIIKDGETAVCNLGSINLSKINTKEDMQRVVPIAIRALDNVIDLNYYPVKKAMETNKKTRAIGLGVMGEAEMLAVKGIMFGSNEHLMLIDELMENFSFNVIQASSDLALEKGSYPGFNGSKWSKGILPIDTANDNAIALLSRTHSEDWDGLREKVKNNGMRNGYLMAIAPTSTISILSGTSQTIEPIFKKKWMEENLSGLIPIVAPSLSPDTWAFYIHAHDLNQIDLVKAAAIRQKWIDQGQSLNIFMRLDKVSGQYLNDIYSTAYQLGLKSTYYLRSESPEYVENKEEIVIDRSIECSGCQ